MAPYTSRRTNVRLESRTGIGRARVAFVALAVVAPLAAVHPALAQEPPQQMRVDSVFAAYDQPSSPGCAVGVVQDGRLAYTRGYGSANLDYQVPLSDSSVFYMASVSKQFTAAAVLLAAKQGKLSVTDDIRKWLPELPDYGKTITIDNLIHHTSGIRDYLTLMPLAALRYEDVLTDDELLQLIARQKELNFDPGSEYLYSNSGYVLLSMIVKRATGKSLREFAGENIFGPLGMTHTHFHDEPLHPIRNRAIGYDRTGDAFAIDYYTNFDKVGDGGLYSSVADLYRWDQSFYDDRLGIARQMLRRGVLTDGDTIEYAFGLNVGTWRGLPTVEHGGSFMGYRTEILRFPQQRFSVITLCNLSQANPSALSQRIAEIYLGDQLQAPAVAAKAAPVALSDAELARWVGAYREPGSGAIVEVARNGTSPVVKLGSRSIPLEAVAADQLRAVDGPALTLRLDGRGSGRHLRVARQGQPAQVFDAATLATPTAAELAAYAGTYVSDELQTTYTLRVDGGRLLLQRRIGEPVALRPTVRDAFLTTGGGLGSVGLVFHRDSSGAVTGFSIQAGRVRNIGFIRR